MWTMPGISYALLSQNIDHPHSLSNLSIPTFENCTLYAEILNVSSKSTINLI